MCHFAVTFANRKVPESAEAVSAPFDAVVTGLLANVGDYLAKGRLAIRLLDIDSVKISAPMPEKPPGSLQEASAFRFVTRGESDPLRLRTVLPKMESRLRSFEARFALLEQLAVSGSAVILR